MIYPVCNIPTEAVGRKMHFVLWVQVGCSKNGAQNKISGHIFRKKLSISSAYIMWSFIRYCSPPTPTPHPACVSSLFCLTYFCFWPANTCIFSTLFHCFLCVCLYMYAHTQSCVSPPIFSNQILATFFVLSHKAALHACACSRSLRFRAELKETWINVFTAVSVPFSSVILSYFLLKRGKMAGERRTWY